MKVDFALISLSLIDFLTETSYSLIAPFLPLEVIEKGIPITMIGYIFSMYSVSVILASPVIGRLLHRYKRVEFM